MVKWLSVIRDVKDINDEIKEYMWVKLYNRSPRLPALRDELSKAKLI